MLKREHLAAVFFPGFYLNLLHSNKSLFSVTDQRLTLQKNNLVFGSLIGVVMRIFQSCTVRVCVSLAEAEVCPCSLFPVVHFSTFLNTPEYLDGAQLSPVNYSLFQVEAPHLTNMLSSLCHCSRIHRRLKHVRVCSDATRGFIVTLDGLAGGACKSSFSATVKAAHIFSCHEAGRKYSDVGG